MEEELNSYQNQNNLSNDDHDYALENVPLTSENLNHSSTPGSSTSHLESTESTNMTQGIRNSPLVLYAINENGSLVPYTFREEQATLPQTKTPGGFQTCHNTSKRYVNLNTAADMVPKFDGKTPSVLSFIRACRSAEKAIHPGDKEFLVTMVRNKIIGNADLYLQNNIEPDSMDSLLEAIRSAFSPPKDLSQLQAQISNVMQSNNESVLQYGIRVSEFLRHTLDAIEEGFPVEAVAGMKLGATQNAISCFIRGLKENIETRITTRKKNKRFW